MCFIALVMGFQNIQMEDSFINKLVFRLHLSSRAKILSDIIALVTNQLP